MKTSTDKPLAVCLLSGGMNSAVCLAEAHVPLLELSKADIVRRARELNVIEDPVNHVATDALA